MAKITLTQAQINNGFLKFLNSTDQKEEIEVEGTIGRTKMQFLPKFTAIIVGDAGEIERTPHTNAAFADISSKYITVEIDKSEGKLPKKLTKTIYQTSAPDLYAELLKRGEEMIAAGGIFPEYIYEGEEIKVMEFTYETNFRISNKNTKSGWTEDGQGNIYTTRTSKYVYFPDFEVLETILRRELRNKSARGEFVDSEIVQQIPTQAVPLATPKVITPTANQTALYNQREASGAPQTEDVNNPGYDIHAYPMKKVA